MDNKDVLNEKVNNKIDMSEYREMLYIAPRKPDYISNLIKETVKEGMNLEELVNKFYEMSKIPVTTESDLLLFETYEEDNHFVFSLLRQIDEPDVIGSYLQINLMIEFPLTPLTNNLKGYCEWDDGLDENFFDFIKKSEPYKVLKNQPVIKIQIHCDSTD